jgi:hypothetical protein
MANELTNYIGNSYDLATQIHFDSGGDYKGLEAALIGDETSPVAGTWNGYFRFPDITLPQGASVSMARIFVNVQSSEGSGNIRYRIRGLDEDNTASFNSGSHPADRSKTDAYTDLSLGIPAGGPGAFIESNVSNIVNEIIQRGGWSSGHAMGFAIDNNGSDNGVYFGSLEAILVYRLSSEPDFKPTPQTIAAPSFNPPEDYGVKVSKPGYDVKTAPDNQLLFTSKKTMFKVQSEGEFELDNTRSVPGDFAMDDQLYHQVTHNLGYPPAFLCFGRLFGQEHCYLSLSGSLSSWPIDGGSRVNSTLLDVSSVHHDTFYFYIFIDPVEDT